MSVCLSVQVLKPISQKKPIPFRFRSQEMRGNFLLLSVAAKGTAHSLCNFLLLSLAAKAKFETGQGQGRAARADTRPLDLLAIYRIFGENWGTCI
jgi:hypothetical protein